MLEEKHFKIWKTPQWLLKPLTSILQALIIKQNKSSLSYSPSTLQSRSVNPPTLSHLHLIFVINICDLKLVWAQLLVFPLSNSSMVRNLIIILIMIPDPSTYFCYPKLFIISTSLPWMPFNRILAIHLLRTSSNMKRENIKPQCIGLK